MSDSAQRQLLDAPLLKLRFINSPPPTIFTASKIQAEDGSPLAIELVDAATNTRVTLDSLSKLEILALDADNNEESWTAEDFNRNILRAREGNRPLLVGNLTVTLKDGIGVIGGDIAFTDNSSWLGSGMFRLGAKATKGGVVEAITKAFVCKDRRAFGTLDSQLWRLDSIAETGVTESTVATGDPSDQQNQKQQFKMSNRFYLPRVMSVTCSRLGKDSYKIKKPYQQIVEWPELKVAIRPIDPPERSDVVLIYRRGHKSNNEFIGHLHAAFSRIGICVHESFDEMFAIPRCRVLIIFLTSSSVRSNLLGILEHQLKKPQVVYPLFHGILPSDLPKHIQAALKETTQMPGYILTDKSESEIIDEIVKDALKVLCYNDKKKMIGMDMQVEEILSLLCIESPDVRSIGLWGTVGIGKTAIAEEILRRVFVQYETCVVLNDVHNEVDVNGLDAVREEFLSKILEIEPHVFRISDIRTSFLRSRLQRKRVLVILDDVNDFRDVETFLGTLNYFGPGSRIILTSRNRRVFVQCKIDHVYDVKPLDIPNSLLLLDPIDRDTLSLELVKFSNGNPLVLKFFSRTRRESYPLSQVQKAYPIYIQRIFERSCCGLDDNEMSIFLDIACFFRRIDKDNVAMLLDGCGFSAHVGFRSLVDKSLLTISHNMVDMLRFIQATGREIVRQESAGRPGDCSRLWNFEDIRDVFIHNTGTSAIEGIFLDMSKLKLDANPHVFEKMCNLRLLKIYCSEVTEKCGVYLPQGLKYLPSKLRLLHWEYYPLSSLPQSFDPKNLVELNLKSSCTKKLWKGKKAMSKISVLPIVLYMIHHYMLLILVSFFCRVWKSFKKMNLSYSDQLTKIPRLSRAPNLELLDLEGCNSLLSISQSISYLKKLVFLSLKDCSKLESIPSTVDLESLDVLNISGCSKIEKFPEISPHVKELYLCGTMIQEIPSSIKNLVLLEKLDLENNRHLVNLPTSICKLKHLETLNLSGCTSLERFPDLSRRMKCLRFLDLSRTAIKELHSSISYMTALEELRFVDCKNLIKLPDNAWSLRFKVEFRQIDREKFTRLWNRFGWLKKIQTS